VVNLRNSREDRMTVQDLETLFDYGYWANKRLFALLPQLTPEQFAQPLADNHGSIRSTLIHMLSAEWGWLGRCGGCPERGPALDPVHYPTAASLIDAWNQQQSRVGRFLSTLGDADLARPVEFSLGGGPKHSLPLGELLQHAANHGVHHRGQVSLLLRLRGYSPDNFDILFYFSEKQRAQG
jgi:uncharacterized damage-inducible protein DinB